MPNKQHSMDRQCGSLTLQHVLSKAPRLLQLIPKEDLGTMFFTSRGLRQFVVNYATSITVPETGLQLLVEEEWPLLQRLDVYGTDRDRQDLHALAGVRWSALAVLNLSFLFLKTDAIQTLASAHLPSLTVVDLSNNSLFTEAIKELVKLSWPRLEKLNLSRQTNGAAFDSSTAACLVQGEWPLLKSLDLSSNDVCLGQLLNGKWPALEDLTLLIMLDEVVPGMVKETSGLAWPALKHLKLSEGAIDDLGIAELTLAKWPCLESVYFEELSVETLVDIFASCQWPALACLELKDIGQYGGIGTNPWLCSSLSKVHLPVLEVLKIHGVSFKAAAMAELAKAVWELLCHVTFSDFQMEAASVVQLVQADWRNLHTLEISCCSLNLDAVCELRKGQWPLLHILILGEKDLWPTPSVERLLDGEWPLLDKLLLSPVDHAAAALLLSGSTEVIASSQDPSHMNTVTGQGPDQWPCRIFATFVECKAPIQFKKLPLKILQI